MPRLTLSERSSTYFLAIPNSSCIQNLSLPVFRNVRCGVTMSQTVLSSIAQMTAPPSTGLRARRSSFQQMMPLAFRFET